MRLDKKTPAAAMTSSPEAAKTHLKIVILGGGGVGKSCLTFRLVHNQFLERYDPTIEDSYRKENFKVDDEICPIEILDTAGQDTFKGMRDLYYKQGDGFVLVYSITDSSSVEDVRERFQSLVGIRCVDGAEIPPVTLVGNKCDLDNQRVVSEDQGRRMAQEFGPSVGFVETSAKANINVEEVFANIVRRIKENDQLRQAADKAAKDKKSRCTLI